MTRADGTTPLEGIHCLPSFAESIIMKQYPRHRSFLARVVVAIGVVLFTLKNFSIAARVVPKNHQLEVDTVMLAFYLAEGESTAKSETFSNDIASVVASSAAPTTILPSTAYNNTEHTKRVEKELFESVSLNMNSSPPSNNTDYNKDGLPTWITNYFDWHRQMRQQFPDQELYEHADAPKVLLKYCKWQGRIICGGLYDRMENIPKMLYVANQTKRVLLIKWYVPMELETFLLPVAINWTAPHHDRFLPSNLFHKNLQKPPKRAKRKTFLEWAVEKPAVEERMLVVHREANSLNLKEKLQALNETDTLEDTSTFGKLWHAMFRPSPLVQDKIDATMKTLGLEAGKYSATHARVRHPGRFAKYVHGKNGSEADVSGLPWHGPNKEMALASAVRALTCTQWLSKSTEEPVYFYADSEDLVQQLLEEQAQVKTGTMTLLAQNNETKADRERQSVLKATKLVARDVSNGPTAHLDRQLGLSPEAYVSTFVDLYIAASARCIGFGVGNFGYLAAMISGTKCAVLYEGHHSKGQARMWNQQRGGARRCPGSTKMSLGRKR
jgi:hypothetical protein